eukprot:2281212-Pyramimonas_sp.AAC.1
MAQDASYKPPRGLNAALRWPNISEHGSDNLQEASRKPPIVLAGLVGIFLSQPQAKAPAASRVSSGYERN